MTTGEPAARRADQPVAAGERSGTTLAQGLPATWRAARLPVLAALLLLTATLAIAVLSSRGNAGRLDPEAYDPAGSRALAELLRAEGVQVQPARTVAAARAAAPGATLLVTDPALVPADVLSRLADAAAAAVLVAPGPVELDAVTGELAAVGAEDVTGRDPQCALPAAQAAGRVDLGGIGYTATTPGAGATLCYPTGSGSALAQAGTVTVLGDGAPLTNERLDERGNAALGLALLGERAQLVWYRPTLDDPALEGGSKPLFALLPWAVKLALLQLGVAVLVLALWRARRLGPVVGEPLPVIVRAAEATEGLARLYRRAGAVGRASTALRAATVRRVAPRFGLPPVGADPRAVTAAVARHTGRVTQEIGELLYGPAPADEAALVRLADELDRLEATVRRP